MFQPNIKASCCLWQVIVIGAGPAGSTLAYELAKRGIEVAVLEKQTFPRYKCCAGGVSVGAGRLLGVDVQGLAENTITGPALASAAASHSGDAATSQSCIPSCVKNSTMLWP